MASTDQRDRSGASPEPVEKDLLDDVIRIQATTGAYPDRLPTSPLKKLQEVAAEARAVVGEHCNLQRQGLWCCELIVHIASRPLYPCSHGMQRRIRTGYGDISPQIVASAWRAVCS